MKTGRTEIELAQAVELILKTPPLPGEKTIPLKLSHGMILASDIFSGINQPPFDRSPLDGYALRAEDSKGASPASPVTLSVAGKLFAGDPPIAGVQRNQAVRIMTGAPIPQGCDCVIKQEEVDSGENHVTIYRSLHRHENFCFCGEDFKAGSLLLKAGTRLNAAAIGVLASAGVLQVPVRLTPRVALLITGDELVEPGPGKTLPPGKIYSSNLSMLNARLCELGFRPDFALQMEDNPETAVKLIKETLEQVDMMITTGGVSVGERDLFNEVFPLMGANQVFHGIKIKPGAPAMFSFLEGKPILSLSGNPFAAAATFELLGRPLLSALAGDFSLLPVKALAALASPYGKKSPFRRFLRGTLNDGKVTLPGEQASGQLRSLAECNCLVEIPPNTQVNEGDILEVYLL